MKSEHKVVIATVVAITLFGAIGSLAESCSGVRRYEACIAHHTPKECADGKR